MNHAKHLLISVVSAKGALRFAVYEG